jgi:uncharacterized protein DUF11
LSARRRHWWLAAVASGALALVVGVAGAAAGSGVVVMLTPDRVVLLLPGSACVSAHVTNAGVPLRDAQVFTDSTYLYSNGLTTDPSPATDSNGNTRLCFRVSNPEFARGGDYKLAAVTLTSPTTGIVAPITSNVVTISIQFPPAPLPPPPPMFPYTLSVRSTLTPAAVQVGDPLVFTATVTNTGSATANGLSFEAEGTMLTLYVPAVEVRAFTATSGACSAETMICTIGSLAPGASVTMTLSGRAATYIPINLTGYAVAGTPGTPTYIQESSSSTVTATAAKTDLAVILPRRPMRMKVGQSAQIPIAVRNNGPGIQIGTYLSVALPHGLKLLTCGKQTCGDSLALGDIESGATAATLITVKATAARTLPLTVTIIPNPNFTDTITANNRGTLHITASKRAKIRSRHL